MQAEIIIDKEQEIQVEEDWITQSNAILHNIACADITNFTNWKILRFLMFSIPPITALKHLQSLPDWESKWENAIRESPVGNPKPYEFYPKSSGNLITHALHLSHFLSDMNCKLDSLNTIFEFGGGYGGMCRLIYRVGFLGEYVNLDLPASIKLQQYYLGRTTEEREIAFLLDGDEFVKRISDEKGRSLFIAAWSISEAPFSLREKVLQAVCANTEYILIVFQSQHREFDNLDFFAKLVEKNTDYQWNLIEVPYLIIADAKHYYLFGKRKEGDDETQLIQKEYLVFEQMTKNNRFEFHFLSRFIKDTELTKYDHKYILHAAWAARILAKIRPEKHVDIASSLHFNTLVSAFIPMDFYEYNPFEINLSNLQMKYADLTALPFPDNSIPSLSCMHVVEHIGLGRYGDMLDPEGDLKAISELKRVLAGDLLFVVPLCGKPKVLFNLHRIYSYDQIIDYFKDLKLVEFALIPDTGCLVEQANGELANEQDYGCGCFWFKKGMKE